MTQSSALRKWVARWCPKLVRDYPLVICHVRDRRVSIIS